MTPKSVVTWMVERSSFRNSSVVASGSQTLLKPQRQCFYRKFPLLSDKLSWKTSALWRCEVLFRNFYCIFGIHIKFCAFWKKRSASQVSYLLYYWLQRMWFLECWIGLLSQHSSAVNVLSDPKRCWNQNDRSFYPTFPWLSDKLSSKTSAVVRWDILGLFFNTLTGYHLFCLHNLGKFREQAQT